MNCPKCKAAMEKVTNKEGVIDRCTQCNGLWFDMLEHEDLKRFAEVVDTGNAEVGARYNIIDQIYCPTCPNSKMLRMVDAKQPHIWFESCPTCYGRFYDAGEFLDASVLSVGDFFKRLLAKERN